MKRPPQGGFFICIDHNPERNAHFGLLIFIKIPFIISTYEGVIFLDKKQLKTLLMILGIFAATYVVLNYKNMPNIGDMNPTPDMVNTEDMSKDTGKAMNKVYTFALDTQIPATSDEFKQTGMATLTDTPNGVEVKINVSGYTTTDLQPAHIKMGACPSTGAVMYPLNPLVNGVSVTTLPEVMISEMKAQLPLSINVHKSATEVAVFTTCTDLMF